MPRLILPVLTSIFAAAGVFAATGAEWARDTAFVVEIEVDAGDLAACRQTLREVGAMPVVADDGTRLLFADTSDLPEVVCVVR